MFQTKYQKTAINTRDRKIYAMYKAGVPVREIGQFFGISRSRVSQVAGRLSTAELDISNQSAIIQP